MRRPLLLLIAGGLALVGAAATVGWWYSRPTTLKIAVTRDSDDAQLIAAMAQVFNKEHEPIRLRVVTVNDALASAAALESEGADLAVVRSDVRLPLNGQTLVLLHRNPAIVLTTRASKVTQLADLRGMAIGVVRGPTTGVGNLRLLESVLAQYELSTRDVRIADITRDQVFDELTSGRVAAVMVVGALTSQTLQDIVATVTRAGGGEPIFLPISEARAMTQRSPVFESMEIVRGAFGGTPPKPAEPFETLGVSVRLMANNAMKDRLAGEVTRLLFANRPSIAQIAPLANQIEAPSTAKGSAIPVHPGAAAFIDDEEKTIWETYSDAIFIGAMVVSMLGSAAAAFASRLGAGGRAQTEHLLSRLLEVLRSARSARDLMTLDTLEGDIDDILIQAISAGRLRTFDAQTMGAMTLAIDQARLAIDDRRRLLQGGPRLLALEHPRAVTRS